MTDTAADLGVVGVFVGVSRLAGKHRQRRDLMGQNTKLRRCFALA